MKKAITFILIIVVVLAFVPTVTLAGGQSVQVTIPSFDVILNDASVDSLNREYPLIVYKNITYFPMTYYDCRYLGLETAWNEQTGLNITSTGITGSYNEQISKNQNSRSGTATICDFPVTLNGKVIWNEREEYPLLVFRDVTYFPLTWRFAVDEFGWEYTYSEPNGLLIRSTTAGLSLISNIESRPKLVFPPLMYAEFPDVPRLENINTSLEITSVNESRDVNIIAQFPNSTVYQYNYNHDGDSRTIAEQYSLAYSDYLQSLGWKLINIEENNHLPYGLFEYTLTSPDNKYHLKVSGYSIQLSPEEPRHYWNRVYIIPNSSIPSSSIRMYSSFPAVPDFGAYYGLPTVRTGNLDGTFAYFYDASKVSRSMIIEYHNLLVNNGFGIGTPGDPGGLFMNLEKEVMVVTVTNAGLFMVGIGSLAS